MLKKFRHQFIATTLLAVIFILVIVIGTINFFNFRTMISNADDILSYLQINKGDFTGQKPNQSFKPQEGFDFEITPEMPYETRYFSVSFSEDGKLLSTDVEKIAAVDKKEAEQIGRKLLHIEEENGFYFN